MKMFFGVFSAEYRHSWHTIVQGWAFTSFNTWEIIRMRFCSIQINGEIYCNNNERINRKVEIVEKNEDFVAVRKYM